MFKASGEENPMDELMKSMANVSPEKVRRLTMHAIVQAARFFVQHLHYDAYFTDFVGN